MKKRWKNLFFWKLSVNRTFSGSLDMKTWRCLLKLFWSSYLYYYLVSKKFHHIWKRRVRFKCCSRAVCCCGSHRRQNLPKKLAKNWAWSPNMSHCNRGGESTSCRWPFVDVSTDNSSQTRILSFPYFKFAFFPRNIRSGEEPVQDR